MPPYSEKILIKSEFLKYEDDFHCSAGAGISIISVHSYYSEWLNSSDLNPSSYPLYSRVLAIHVGESG